MKVTYFDFGLAIQPTKYVELKDALLAIEHASKVVAIRRGLGGKLGKKGLPFILPAGIFSGGRKITDFVKSSGILYIDIDSKENTLAVAAIREYLVAPGNCPWLYALQSSCGGGGLSVFLRIPSIKSREAYRAYYKEVALIFLRAGIVVDKSCININRQRFVSIDPDTYINEKAEVLKLVVNKVKKHKPEPLVIDNELKSSIMTVVKSIEAEKYDMTEDYNTWLYVAGLFHKVFGEDQGRKLFHRVSKFYRKYSRDEADAKYDYCRSFENASPHKFFNLLTPKLKMR